MGRPSKGGRLYTVRLTPSIVDRLRRLGDGNLTLGIERAAQMAADKEQ